MAGSKSRGTGQVENKPVGADSDAARWRRKCCKDTIGCEAPVALTMRSASINLASRLFHDVAAAGILFCQLGGGLFAAVDDRDVLGAFITQVDEDFFRSFAGANHQDLLIVEAFEDVAGKIADSHTGDADAVVVDGGFGGDALGDAQGALKNIVSDGADAVLLSGELIGLFDLSENFAIRPAPLLSRLAATVNKWRTAPSPDCSNKSSKT